MEPKTVSIDEIKLWNVKALQDFLRKRNLKASARKEELVALVFAALQMPEYASPRTSDCEQEKESAKANAYKDLLQTSHGTLPDPNLLPDAEWQPEAEAIQKWPQTMAFDIGIYLESIDDVPLRARLMSDYKDGKAYSYFASGWVKEIFFHGINETSQYCFLKSQCRPSQALSNLPWKVWVAFHTRTGRIHSAFCTCFAGYSGACNHVAAILFKVDFAWRNGLTNPACTSRECEWAAFGAKQKVKPKRICEMTWSKPKFSKSGIANEEGINSETRQLFSPSGTCEMLSRPTLPNLVSALLPNFTDACAFTYCSEYIQADATVNFQPWEDVNVGHYEEVEFVELPLPLMDLADDATSLEGFLNSIPTYSYETVGELEKCTRGQASNHTWFLHRKGRITGSVVHSVVTRGRRLMSESSVIDNTSLIRRLLYDTVSPDVPALKYGREMETEARLKYIKVMRAFGHPSLIVDECGLFVDSEQVYLGASPDGIVHCGCCGKGVLEIKCPLSVSHTIPDSSNLSYIVEGDGKMTLKTSHQYYTQVQLQMGISKARWCDIFVYSRHGYIRIRVNFNREMWTEIKECSEHFFTHHLAKEMFTKDILSHILKSNVK